MNKNTLQQQLTSSDSYFQKDTPTDEDSIISESIDNYHPYQVEIYDEEDKLQTKDVYSLSNPRKSQIQKLSAVRKKNCFNRFFRTMKEGSMRAVVLLWVRMTMGVGILTLPALFSNFGICGGIIALLLGMLICLISYRFIFFCTTKTQIKEYSELVKALLPNYISYIFKFTYFLDMMAFATVYSIFAWKLVVFLASIFGLFQSDWYSNQDKFEIKEYHPTVFLIRTGYYIILYILLIPLLLKKSMEKLKPIAMIFLGVIIILVIDIMIEAPFFRQFYIEQQKQNPEKNFSVEYFFKTPQFSWVPIFFSLILSYYVQPFILVLRKELLAPSKKRLNKVAFLSVLTEFILYICFAVWIYYCFGDQNIVDLIILRKSYSNKTPWTEYIFNFFIICFWVLNNIGLSIYNPGMRQYLSKFIKLKSKKINHVLLSLLPLFIAFVIAIIYPNVLGMFWIIGLVFCNFNGFIIPAWMRLAIYQKEKAPWLWYPWCQSKNF